MVDKKTLRDVDSVVCENKEVWRDTPAGPGLRLEKQFVECRISHTTVDVEGKPMKAIETVRGDVGVGIHDHAASAYIFVPKNPRQRYKMAQVSFNFQESDHMYCEINSPGNSDHKLVECSKEAR